MWNIARVYNVDASMCQMTDSVSSLMDCYRPLLLDR